MLCGAILILHHQCAGIVHIQCRSLAGTGWVQNADSLTNCDAIPAIAFQYFLPVGEKTALHPAKSRNHLGGYHVPIHRLSRRHFQGTGEALKLCRKVCKLLIAVNPNANHRIGDVAILSQPHFGEDSGQLSFLVYNVVCPLDAGTETGGTFYGITGG